MTGHRLDNTGALLTVAEPLPHPVEWRLADKHGWYDRNDVVFFTQKWVPKWSHRYLITGSLSGIGMALRTRQLRTFYAKIGSGTVWTASVGALGAGPEGSLVNVPVPILGLWTAPDEVEVELTVGMRREDHTKDQDWELGNGVHNVHVIDLGCLA